MTSTWDGDTLWNARRMTTPSGVNDGNSHATELRGRWTLPENATSLAEIRSLLTTGTGYWRTRARTWTQPWGAGNAPDAWAPHSGRGSASR